jgi:ribosome biogenesis GTPase
MVIAVDRGRWTCVLDDNPAARIVAMRARELGRTPIVVGDRVGLVGDLSGSPDTLARIVRVADRASVLRRTADDSDPYERVIVANAEQLVIVTALADPPPSIGFVDRALVAAYAGGLRPLLCLTKADLAESRPAADPAEVASAWAELDLPVVVTRYDREPEELRRALSGRISAFIGHSGVGKSTLVNALVPEADRAVGQVSGIGKGRHTSSSVVAMPLPPVQAHSLVDPLTGSETPPPTSHESADKRPGGWVIDTPGVRSFGLAHVSASDVVSAFADLAAAIKDCPRGCGHLGPPSDPECALDELAATGRVSPGRLSALRRVLVALTTPAWA